MRFDQAQPRFQIKCNAGIKGEDGIGGEAVDIVLHAAEIISRRVDHFASCDLEVDGRLGGVLAKKLKKYDRTGNSEKIKDDTQPVFRHNCFPKNLG